MSLPSLPVLRCLALALCVLLPLIVLHRALLLGEAFLPADLLTHLYPWQADTPPTMPWNVLRFDGITQFYPWRLEAARQMAAGQLPFWNPYQFAASGGTPLLANSQSAPLYPPNLLFVLFHKAGAFWYAWGLSTALHLGFLAMGMYRLLRAIGLRRVACALGTASLALSGPLIAWLSLPTFLAVSAYLPWLCLGLRTAHIKAGTGAGRVNLAASALCIGLMLLAGHLQIAVYCGLASGLYLLWHGHFSVRVERRVKPLTWAGAVVGAGLLGVSLSLPQVLPVLTLSRFSSRAIAGAAPTMEAYRAFTSSAFPLRSLVTFLVPDFFGHPNHNDGFYWNSNNYGEWAAYVGIVPFVLALIALALPWRGQSAVPKERAFFAGLAAFALLMAMGTPLNLPFFFLVPGYSQFGNPGRVLVVLAFALSGLAAFGLHGLLSSNVAAAARRRATLAGLGIAGFVALVGLVTSALYAGEAVRAPFSDLLLLAAPGIGMALLLIVLTGAGLLFLARTTGQKQTATAALLVLLTLADLAVWGYGYNPTLPPSRVYPVTPGIRWLQANAQNALVAPLNRTWSMSNAGPHSAVLPPNALTVYGLHDVQGYDSLFPAEAKARVKDAGAGVDPSPPENGNIVFVKQAEAARALGARYLIVPPDAPDLSGDALQLAYQGADMIVYRSPNGRDFAPNPAAVAPYARALQTGAAAAGVSLLLLGLWTAFALLRAPTPSHTSP